jgi:hypothetical protein
MARVMMYLKAWMQSARSASRKQGEESRCSFCGDLYVD